MSKEGLLKGRRGYEEMGVSSRLQSLTLASPESETNQDQPGKVQDGAWSPLYKPAADCQQFGGETNVTSSESLQGLNLHVVPPSVPADGQAVYERDGVRSTGWDGDSENLRYSSLPATLYSTQSLASGHESHTRSAESHTSSSEAYTSSSEAYTSSSEYRQPTGSSEGSGSSSLSPTPNCPLFKSILPTSSSDHSKPAQGQGSTPEAQDMSRPDKVCANSTPTDTHVAHTVTEASETQAAKGFVFGSSKELLDYLNEIVLNQVFYGRYISKELKPRVENNVTCYRRDKEFTVVQEISKQGKGYGVFVCRDNTTGHPFVWKKIRKTNNRLIGLEFLTLHNQHFLPKVYGIYKEKENISIFQEYIEGGMLLHTCWNLAKIRELAEQLLSAVQFLHTQGLVHWDIKLRNLMVRDKATPRTLVLIDFESAKHCSQPFHNGGYTLTYLPPWHERLLSLEHYDDILKTADLWAVACVIIFFLIPVPRCDLEKHGGGEVWSQALQDIKRKCKDCRNHLDNGKYCRACRGEFLHYVAHNGHTILQQHLGHLMEQDLGPNWKALRQLLVYLTDLENIQEKHVGIALDLIRGPVCHPTEEGDNAIRR